MVSLHILHSSFIQTIELNSFSNSDFQVATPPVLTHAEYTAFLDSLPVHPSRLYFAVKDRAVEEVREILRNNPNLDFNWWGEKGTAFYIACSGGSDIIVSLLLAHPDIDVNVKDNCGCTPFYRACYHRHTSCVRVMLKDSRVKLNEPDIEGHTPLWYVAGNDTLDIIKWWIASGREMDLGKPGDVEKTDAIGGAKKYGKADVVALLERFKSDATKTRHATRVEFGLLDELAAEMFALVVFVSDGLLQIKDTTSSPAARFLNIARRFPLELQMLLCYRVAGSDKEIIPGKDSEEAFKSLAESLLWSSIFTTG